MTARRVMTPLPTIPDDKDIKWDQAACANHAHPELFFTDDHQAWFALTQLAIQVCEGCPIRTDCFQYAYDRRLWGVWGGTVTSQRETIRRKNRRGAA